MQKEKEEILGKLSFLYDILYREGARIIRNLNPCEIGWGGKCKVNEKNGCCKGCKHLGKKGCKVECLGCKLYLCPDITSKNKKDGLVSLTHLEYLARRYRLAKGYSSKEEVMSSLAERPIEDLRTIVNGGMVRIGLL